MKSFIQKVWFVMGLGLLSNHILFSEQSIYKSLVHVKFICCIDGGGSKTILDIINPQQELISFFKDDKPVNQAVSLSTNIETIGLRRMTRNIEELFEGITFGEKKIPFEQVVQDIVVIGGFAGYNAKNSESIRKIFKDIGFRGENIFIYNDCQLLLESFEPGEILLSSGIGSNCMGKMNDGSIIRAGGIGWLLGDEGSGYKIGWSAIKAAMELEFGFGHETELHSLILDYFNVDNLECLIAPLQQQRITPQKIASLAPFVFKTARKNDTMAMQIIYNAACSLGDLLSNIVSRLDTHSSIYLMGGLFKGEHKDWFIRSILCSSSFKEFYENKRFTINLVSDKNPAIVATLKFLNHASI